MLQNAEYYQLGLNHPIMQTYYSMLTKVAVMLGADPEVAKKDMKDLLEFEISLANVGLSLFCQQNKNMPVLFIKVRIDYDLRQVMIPPDERRIYSQIYQKMALSKLQAEVPAFNFTRYLDNLLTRPVRSDEMVVMYALPYFKSLMKLVESSDKR